MTTAKAFSVPVIFLFVFLSPSQLTGRNPFIACPVTFSMNSIQQSLTLAF